MSNDMSNGVEIQLNSGEDSVKAIVDGVIKEIHDRDLTSHELIGLIANTLNKTISRLGKILLRAEKKTKNEAIDDLSILAALSVLSICLAEVGASGNLQQDDGELLSAQLKHMFETRFREAHSNLADTTAH